jgi:hypothetical protein
MDQGGASLQGAPVRFQTVSMALCHVREKGCFHSGQ